MGGAKIPATLGVKITMVSWRPWLLSSLLVVLVLCGQDKALMFTNVTDEVGLRQLNGADVAVAAFVDVNADKHLNVPFLCTDLMGDAVRVRTYVCTYITTDEESLSVGVALEWIRVHITPVEVCVN